MPSFNDLRQEVIQPGLCTLCGTCVAVCSARSIAINFESEEPVLVDECNACGLCYKSCPGKEIPLPNLERMLFGRERSPLENDKFGIVNCYLKGYASDPFIRGAGASGGVVSALLACALEKGLVDAAIVVAMSRSQPWKAEPRIAKTRAHIIDAAQSKYMVVPVNSVLAKAAEEEIRRLAIAGCPCHIHGLRKMQLYRKPKNIISKIELMLGLFCGTNFSFRATEHVLREWIGIPLDTVQKLEYRGGTQSKDLCVTTNSGTWRIPWVQYRPFMTAFQRERCTICYDWAAELGDVSIGDMFSFKMGRLDKIPKWSGIIVRTDKGEELVEKAKNSDYIKAFPAKETEFLSNVGYEEKKHGNAYRIIYRKKHNLPTPDWGYRIRLKTREPLKETESHT